MDEKKELPPMALSGDYQAPDSRRRPTLLRKLVPLLLGILTATWVVSFLHPDMFDSLDVPVVVDMLGGTPTYKERALRIMSKHPLIDGHNDLAIQIYGFYGDKIYSKAFKSRFEHGDFIGSVDLPRINKGKYAGAFWSAFFICPADPYDFSTKAYSSIVHATEQQIDLLLRLRAAYPTYFPETRTPDEARDNFKHHKHIAPLIIEGLHQIGNSAATLRNFFRLGVRYATLTWNCPNRYADSALVGYPNGTSVPAPPYWGGISLKGRKMILEMNRLGMIVDLAHTSADTQRDILVGKHNPKYPPRGPPPNSTANSTSGDEDADADTDADVAAAWHGSVAIPIFSHSSVYAICPHPRNVRDDVLELVKQRRSIVMINFNPDFIACHYPPGADPKKTLPVTDKKDATLERVAEHVMYVGKKIGYEYVGLGSDFDGIEVTPRGLSGVDKMPDLVARLLEKGVTRKQVIGIIGGNVLRVWDNVVATAAKLQAEGALPLQDNVPSIG